MGGQLDEHLLFWQPAISIILYFALYIVLLFEMQVKYDDDDDDDDDDIIEYDNKLRLLSHITLIVRVA